VARFAPELERGGFNGVMEGGRVSFTPSLGVVCATLPGPRPEGEPCPCCLDPMGGFQWKVFDEVTAPVRSDGHSVRDW
jgi:hypothetical protein